MQNRQRLIKEVKAEYARLADMESKNSFVSLVGTLPPEAYYEKLLGEVLSGIDSGLFDGFAGGREIVDAVAKNHSRWGIGE